jgi:hypothetical protein
MSQWEPMFALPGRARFDTDQDMHLGYLSRHDMSRYIHPRQGRKVHPPISPKMSSPIGKDLASKAQPFAQNVNLSELSKS